MKTMKMRVEKEGRRLLVRLPRGFAAARSIGQGTLVTVEVAEENSTSNQNPNGRAARKPRRRSPYRLKDLLGKGPAKGGEIDIGPPIGKEII